MNKKRYYLTILFLICLLLSFGLSADASRSRTSSTVKFAKSKHISKKLLDSMKLKNVNKLMIVAHPDDDILWGGMHLIQENYLVVCLTNAQTKQYGDRRAKEFRTAMNKTRDPAIIMYYPDKTNGMRDQWTNCSPAISKDLSILLAYKPWKVVVTHGVKGEYGHIQHKLTNQLVTKAFHASALKGCSLEGFGTYYSLKNVKKYYPKSIYSQKQIAKKKKILDVYKSQNTTQFEHMIGYENWSVIASK